MKLSIPECIPDFSPLDVGDGGSRIAVASSFDQGLRGSYFSGPYELDQLDGAIMDLQASEPGAYIFLIDSFESNLPLMRREASSVVRYSQAFDHGYSYCLEIVRNCGDLSKKLCSTAFIPAVRHNGLTQENLEDWSVELQEKVETLALEEWVPVVRIHGANYCKCVAKWVPNQGWTKYEYVPDVKAG